MPTFEDITDRHIDQPLTEGIVLRRDENGILTNVPHFVTHHSPTGFEFGYGGSGPADLALNLVEAILRHIGHQGETTECYDGVCFSDAFRLHQEFKWQFIASVSRDGGTFSYAQAEEWVRTHLPSAPQKG